jgi:2'-5' RNA ligase superfamily
VIPVRWVDYAMMVGHAVSVMTVPIILTAEMGKSDQAWANGLRQAHFPPERNFLAAHITLFHHLPPSHLAEIKTRLAALTSGYAAPAAQLSEVMMLGRGVAYRVDSSELLSIRDELVEVFQGLLVPQDQARPRFHITVQNKVEPAVAKVLHAELSATFKPRPLAISGLAAHYYRGGPWEHIQSWKFRGPTT